MIEGATASGVPGLGEISWGSHICHFYDTRDDLADTLVPYFITGLRANDACVWVTSEPFTVADARAALAAAIPDLDRREREGQLEIIDHREWYLRTGAADAAATLQLWVDRERAALQSGRRGLRLTGNTVWLERGGWDSFVEYERLVNEAFRERRIVGLCSYCAARCSAHDVLDVIANHQMSLARRGGRWQLVESAALRLARADLERLQQATEGLRAAERRKDEFLAMLGHELRNPLAPIATAVHLIKLRGGKDTYGRELDVVDRQVRHLTELVNDLLDVSRIARGKLELRRTAVELRDVVAGAIEMASPLIEQQRHRLTVDVPAEGLVVDGDPGRLAQVVTNLLINAAKYSTPGGRIEVHAHAEDDAGVLRVADDGPGIDRELLPHVFELFVQGERSLDRAQGGLGLGLPLVKSLVELHGGTVELHSDATTGTQVTLRLPTPRTTPQPSGPQRAASVAGGPRVLVVDDNEDAAQLLADVLQLSGYEPVIAADGPTALTTAARVMPVAAILDIGLPVMDGFQLAGRLRQLPGLSALKLIALTGYGAPDDHARSSAAGFDRHVVKPIELKALLEHLGALLS